MNIKPLKILVVEDDELFSIGLEVKIKELGYELMGVVDNAKTALNIIDKKQIEFALLDINIKGNMDGIELGKQLHQRKLPFIFITGYADQATYQRARVAYPLAYLTKPFSSLQLQAAIDLAIINFSKNTPAQSASDSADWKEDHMVNELLFVKTNIGILSRIQLSNVKIIEANGNYCFIHTSSHRFMVRISLRKFMEQVSFFHFARIHRNFIVAIPAIEEVNLSEGTVKVDDKYFPLSMTYKKSFLDKINQL